MKRLRIALLAPFEEPVPPQKYGGTERVVYSLAEELIRLGHDVTLLASGDSKTSARLVPCVETSTRPFLNKNPRTWAYLNCHGFQRALHHLRSERYDIIHNHGDWPFLIASDVAHTPIVTTIHNPVQYKLGVPELYKQYPHICISDAQRAYLPDLDFTATIHHGIDLERFEYGATPENYLAFLGRINPDKGPKEAIAIARQTGNKLIIAAKIDPPDRQYFQRIIKPLIDGRQIVFLGEVDHAEKVELLKNARALLSPIQWDEPFGLVNIEAMACGTPVLSIGRGSLPEIVVNGATGYLTKTVEELAKRVADIPKIKRQSCRKHVEQHFSAAGMAKKYIEVYKHIIAASKPKAATLEA